MPSIVDVVVSQTIAPTPNTLQKKGGFVSQGATTTTSGTKTLLTQLSDLTSILKGAAAISTMTWLAGVVTVTTAAPHGIPNGEQAKEMIVGAAPAGYNGLQNVTSTGASTFTFPLATNPGTMTTPGTYVGEDVSELATMGTTFFGQGATQSVWVLELGEGNPADGVAALNTYIQSAPNDFYSFLVPRAWTTEPTYLTFLQQFNSLSAKRYFFTTMTPDDYASFPSTLKCVFGLVEAPSVVAAASSGSAPEFSLAAPFYKSLNYAPSATNKVTPFAWSFLYGVTEYPTFANGALLDSIIEAGANYVGDGGEGGISDDILVSGTTMDGNDFTYWYAVDWMQINGDLNVANEVINGSNNPTNPLYYNQDGINRLQSRLASTVSSGVSYGLILGAPVQTQLAAADFVTAVNSGAYPDQTIVNAEPFIAYSEENPNDYKIGRYSGFSVAFTPARGFIKIVINVNVSQFVAQ